MTRRLLAALLLLTVSLMAVSAYFRWRAWHLSGDLDLVQRSWIPLQSNGKLTYGNLRTSLPPSVLSRLLRRSGRTHIPSASRSSRR